MSRDGGCGIFSASGNDGVVLAVVVVDNTGEEEVVVKVVKVTGALKLGVLRGI